MNLTTEADSEETTTKEKNPARRYADTRGGEPHTQKRGRMQLALTVIERALDAIEDEADEDALQWISDPTTGRLPLEDACSAAGDAANVAAVQEEARERLAIFYADDDPLEHDEVDDLQVLKDHALTWITKREGTNRFGVTMSMIQHRLENGTFDSVRAPKSFESDLPVRYVPVRDLQQAFA